MDYDPLDEKPRIRFDKSDWAILIFCITVVLFMIMQLFRSVI